MEAFHEPDSAYGSAEFEWSYFCQESHSKLIPTIFDGEKDYALFDYAFIDSRTTSSYPNVTDLSPSSSDPSDQGVDERRTKQRETKRKAQNRAAQKAFRERKLQQLQHLEEENSALRRMVETLGKETEGLKNRILEMSACPGMREELNVGAQKQRRVDEAQERLLSLEKDLMASHTSQQKCTSHDCLILGMVSCIRSLAVS
ncbi:hypothetical protein M409DRAFT_48616 [Zasmidium cellare ATCC 36951]|uniref:BZIP domain-containing protein n=1 Tax=Zasmidium cellare ATCC 36951 TaxID=1080233 RepID=A0A6A6D2N4_ZASCE|nr:uncharacterized protein M409DRAFT_48616 [Zasmidium cellare ATCC 36951]KAF2173674.1 hypothetical protein M409DRAFT_48616 [Zasmidium cellare ATCC 36951]